MTEDLFAQAEAYLAEARDAFMSRVVNYARGVFAVDVLAMAVAPSHLVVDGDQTSVRVEGRDYVLRYFGIEPERGDVITDGGTKFEVADPPDGEAHFRWCDASRTSIRVHCRRVA